MEHTSTPLLLFWSSVLLNAVTLSSNMPAWAKWVVAALGVLLTIISLINQSVTLYKNASEWRWILLLKAWYRNTTQRKQDGQ